MTEQGYSVLYSPAALEDLKTIYVYIADELKAPQAAANQVNRIRKRLRKLDIFPERYEVVEWEPWMSLGLHKLPIDNYVAFYSVDKEALSVTIFRIFYGRRNVKEIINELAD